MSIKINTCSVCLKWGGTTNSHLGMA